MSHLRDYQLTAKAAIEAALSNGSRSTLSVQPTGTGKTEVFLSVAHDWPQGKVLTLAHRDELVWQPFDRWRENYGEYAEMEMGEYHRNRYSNSKLICGTAQTLYNIDRLKRAFPDPNEVGLLIIDEAHHAVKDNVTYNNVVEYFSKNPDFRMMGTTATADRTDEAALGQMFDSVAFEYPLLDPAGGPSAISDGWLCPIVQEYIIVETIDFDGIGTRGGDLIASQLEQEMVKDKVLYRIVEPTLEKAGDRPTLVFTAGVKHASRVTALMNSKRDGSAYCIVSRMNPEDMHDFVVMSGDKEARHNLTKRFARGNFQYLVNVGVATEGYDAPHVACVSMGRPTKSRSLCTQMIGRGTRVLKNVIEGRNEDESWWRLDTPEKRKAAISESLKPHVSILDFVGNSRHALISSADILGGSYPDEVVERAKKSLREKGGGDVQQALLQAETDILEEMERRKHVKVKATYESRIIDPFAVLGIIPRREPGWHKGRTPTPKMKAALQKFKVPQPDIDKMSFHQAGQMLDKLMSRVKEDKASFAQCKVLAKYGESTDVTFQAASSIIDQIAKGGWRPRHQPVEVPNVPDDAREYF